jgi:UDP-N-acetylmuramate--alanine ligase
VIDTFWNINYNMKPTKSIFENISPKSVHFVGIGGIGVSSLAYWFRAQKWAVSGSDSASSKITLGLKKAGFKVKIGHKKGLLGPKIGLVIYSNAVKSSNPELREAQHRGIPALSYPEVVGALTRRYITFGVAGAHGKSTTTSLLSLVLVKAGWDPTVIVGTKLKEFGPPAGGKNFRLGKSDFLVLEADEWAGAFWNYSPMGAIITNIDKEHLDFYKNFGNVKKSFLKFIGNILSGGILVANRDDEKLLALRPIIEKMCGQNGVKVVWYSVKNLLATNRSLLARIKKNLSIPGWHNVSNAMAVYVLAKNLGIPEKKILAALKSYHGAWRRMEYRGYFQNALVYDDYAHHPTEIKATLEAFREKYPDSKLICVFQPHQAHRLRVLFNDFAHAFKDADELILLPSYKVAGRDIQSKKYTSEALARKVKGTLYLANPKNLRDALEKLATKNSVIIMMGAGTVVEYTDELLKWRGGKISSSQKEILDALFREIPVKSVKRVLDMGSGRTSLEYLTSRFRKVRVQAILYPGDRRKIDPILENVRHKNYRLIETDIKKFKPRMKFDIVLAHLFLGEAEKFGKNKFRSVLASLLSIRARYLVIVDIRDDKSINYELLFRELAGIGKIRKAIIKKRREDGKRFVGILVEKR